MGPTDRVFSEIDELQKFRKEHGDVIITYPSETQSGLWEASVPDASTMAFDSIRGMLDALSGMYERQRGHQD